MWRQREGKRELGDRRVETEPGQDQKVQPEFYLVFFFFFFHSPLFHKHLVPSCTNQKIKVEKGVGKISVMCWGRKGEGLGASPLPPHTAPNAGYGPCRGDLRRRWQKTQGS